MKERNNRDFKFLSWRNKRAVLALGLGFSLLLSGCAAGYKINPSDSDLEAELQQPTAADELSAGHETDEDKVGKTTKPAAKEAADAEQSDTQQAAKQAADESESDESKAVTADQETPTDKAEDKAAEAKSTAAKDTEKPAATTVAQDLPPTVSEVKELLRAEDFTFYVNDLVTDPEPQSVVYAAKEAGNAELTVFYAIFKDQAEADEAIANLLDSDMIGKALSFGAELEKLLDKSGEKQYTVSLSSFLATARAEMRQAENRIGLVLLYKKNEEIVFEPYFEMMGLEAK